MFEGFSAERVAIDEDLTLHVRRGGSGPPLLLLHGYPQCHLAWHRVAPLLAKDFTLVIPDLPGYGDSGWRGADAAHLHQSKRQMAADLVALMAGLGHPRFAVAGHDRGGRVAYRMAFDHPERVTRLAAVDIVPTLEVWNALNGRATLRTFHWPFLAQPRPLPERLIAGDPDRFLMHLVASWAGRPDALDPDALAEYRRHFAAPAVLEASCEDYRAGAGVDVDHDRGDREAGRRIGCPTLVVWGRRYFQRSPLAIWQAWAAEVREAEIDCGHFIAEEAPEDCAAALRELRG
jgi:haloacetate dehalogenase